MRRFWLDDAEWANEQLTISGSLVHHIHDVCRFNRGDRFELLHDGKAYFVEIEDINKRTLTVKRLETRQIPEMQRPHVHLALSIPRFSKVDWIVEKSVELGAKALHPFVSDYSFARKVEDIPQAKMERWGKLIKQASQQCGRGELMELNPAQSLDELLDEVNRRPNVLSLFPYEGACMHTLRQALRAADPDDLDEVWIFVGSEGGFSNQEIEKFHRHGMEPLSLGPQVLRVETACVALVSILKYEFGELD